MVAGDTTQQFIPSVIKQNHFIDSRLSVGEEGIATRGHEIVGNTFKSGLSRSFDAIKLINCSRVRISENNAQEFKTFISVTPTVSFSSDGIIIENNSSFNCIKHVELLGTSMFRISNVRISGNTFSGSRRESSGANNDDIRALFVSGLTIDGHTIITHKRDCLKAQACFSIHVEANEFSALANEPTFRFSGCVDVAVIANKFNNEVTGGYIGLFLAANAKPVVSGNNYQARNFRFENNEIRGFDRGLKIENTKGARVLGNTFTLSQAINEPTGVVWFASGNRSTIC